MLGGCVLKQLLAATVLALMTGTVPAARGADFLNETLDDGTEAIIMVGEIVKGDEDTFRDLSIRFPNALVVLESPGGALVPALEIGRLIRLRGYTTVVLAGDTCVSACALVWLAGSERIMAEGADVGFHASYFDDAGKKVESGLANALVGHYLSQLNLSQRAVVFATMAPPDDIAWLSAAGPQMSGIGFERVAMTSGEEEPVQSPPPIQTYAVAPTPNTQEFLKATFRAPEMAENAARALGVSESLTAPIAEHIRQIYSNDAIIERLAQELDASKIDIAKNPQAVGTLFYRLTASLIPNGLQRLPQSDVNNYMWYMSYIVKSEGKNCDISQPTELSSAREFSLVSQLGESRFNSYLALLRKAMFAEVQKYPARVTLARDQVEMAENAWAELLVAKIESIDESELANFSSAIDNFEAAPPSEQCALTKIMVPTASEMDGIVGDWFRRVFLTYITDSM